MPTIDGTSDDDTLTGTNQDEMIYGREGNDAIDGGSGYDIIYGGLGDDIIDGGEGIDTASFYDVPGSPGLIANLATGVASGGMGSDLLYGIENLTGTMSNDTLIGDSLANVLNGLYGDDELSGDIGNDALIGYEGDDRLIGNAGEDTLHGGNGDDHLASHDPSPGFGGWDGSSLDIHAERDSLFGGDGSDRIYAGYGDNIDGGADGTYGDYLYISFLGASSGVTVDFREATQVIDGGIITGIENISWVQGSDFDDNINVESHGTTFYAEGTRVYGMGGNDHLVAGYSTAELDGGDGNDVMVAQGSPVTADGGAGNDRFVSGSAADFFNGGDGIDTVYYQNSLGGVTVTLADFGAGTEASGDHLFDVENVYGSYGNDQIHGNSGANLLRGLGGNDELNGGAGNDRLEGGDGFDHLFGGLGDDTYVLNNEYASTPFTDYVAENVDEGIDTVLTNAIYYNLDPNIENLTFTGSADAYGVGNELANVIKGTSARDNLEGREGADRLVGNDGDDYLDGGTGADRMYGGLGGDIFVVDDSADYIVEYADEGHDLVYASATHALRANVEELVLQGDAAIDGHGNDLDNTIVGNEDANYLTGRLGNDSLLGEGGADILRGGDGDDYIDAGAGRDRMFGEAGADYFAFSDGDFAGMTNSTSDQIHDFNSADYDRISLQAVDADTTVDGNQAFAFIGNAEFTGAAGELRYQQKSGVTYVQGDVDGDGAADFWIRLDGLHTLQASDFIM